MIDSNSEPDLVLSPTMQIVLSLSYLITSSLVIYFTIGNGPLQNSSWVIKTITFFGIFISAGILHILIAVPVENIEQEKNIGALIFGILATAFIIWIWDYFSTSGTWAKIYFTVISITAGLFIGYIVSSIFEPEDDLQLIEDDPFTIAVRTVWTSGLWQQAKEMIAKADNLSQKEKGLNAINEKSFFDPPQLNEWIITENDSLAYILRALCYLYWAWHIRGTGPGSSVPREAWPLFYQRIEMAEKDLYRAIELGHKDSLPWGYLLITSKALERDIEHIFKIYNNMQQYTVLYSGYSNMLSAISPQWCGSHEDMHQFAKQVCSEKGDQDRQLYCLVAQAHINSWCYLSMRSYNKESKKYFQSPEVHKEIIEAAEKCIFPPQISTSRELLETQNYFAMCFWLMDKKRRAAELFEQIDTQVCEFPWCFYGDPIHSYRQAYNDCKSF